MRGLDLTICTHTHTHTHTHTQTHKQRCQKCTDLLSALSPAKWLGLSHRQAKNPRIMLTTEGRVLEEILKTKFNLRSGTEEEDELKIAPRP